jgi:microcin C transport system substrate-binding protein
MLPKRKNSRSSQTPIARAASCIFVAATALIAATGTLVAESGSMTLYGVSKYPSDFPHFSYVNPSAPKGGELREYALGAFDSINPFILKGVPPRRAELAFDTLMVSSKDEPFSQYGLLAESVDVSTDRKSVVFQIRANARFHDGSPVRASDIVASFTYLKASGHPSFSLTDIEGAQAIGELRVKYTFSASDRTLPFVVGLLPVMSEENLRRIEFSSTTSIPMGSGPYVLEVVDFGRSVTYRRVSDYWGADLPVNKGRYNFDRIRIDYFRDEAVALEAFIAGLYHVREETGAARWATGYPTQLRAPDMKRLEVPNLQPQGFQGYVFNQRRFPFNDARVREALNYAFDFEWANANLFYGQYRRNTRFFPHVDELGDSGNAIATDGSVLRLEAAGNRRESARERLATAARILSSSGWILKGNTLTHEATGKALQFELLLQNQGHLRFSQSYLQALSALGIKHSVRVVDGAQYAARVREFDFDMIVHFFPQSYSFGVDQEAHWGSRNATESGSGNVAGLADAEIDNLIAKIRAAPDTAQIVRSVRALDGALLKRYVVVPHWHIPYLRLAYWNRFGMPYIFPRYGVGFFDTWWALDAGSKQ